MVRLVEALVCQNLVWFFKAVRRAKTAFVKAEQNGVTRLAIRTAKRRTLGTSVIYS